MSKDWKLYKLNEAYIVKDGTHDSPKYVDVGYPLITSKNLKNGYLIYDKVKYISEEDYKNINKRSKVDQGDLLFAMIGTIGNPVIINHTPKFAIKNVALFKKKDNSIDFLKYFLSSKNVVDKMKTDAKGATQKFVSLGYLRDFQIPLPPLEEQQKIVEKLDKAFELIDQAKANIEQNISNAKELFQSKLDEVFSQKGDGWEIQKLNEIVTIRPPKKESKDKISDSDKVTFLPMEDLGINQIYITPQKEKCLGEVYKGYTYFSEGDLLVAKITPCFENGKMGIAKGLINSIGFGSSEYIVLRNNSEVPTELIYYNLLQDKFREIGKYNMQGAVGHKRVTVEFVENYDIVIPKNKISQLDLVNRLQYYSNYTENLISAYKNKLECLEELRKSILEKAFKGELTN